MLDIKAEGLTELKGYFEALAKDQLPFATKNALNDVAFEVRKKQIDLIKSTFDRPKPQTARNVFVKMATKDRLRAVVLFDQIYNKGIDEYMRANIHGGRRSMKPSEQRLGRYYVPGMGAKMDKYGNMKGGQITQILSRLGRFGDVAGYNMNQTAASKKRRGSKAVEYFMVQQKRGGLMPGIYQRMKDGKPLPVMVFTKQAPQYRAVWPFYQVSQDVVDQSLVPAMERRIAQALRSAR